MDASGGVLVKVVSPCPLPLQLNLKREMGVQQRMCDGEKTGGLVQCSSALGL